MYKNKPPNIQNDYQNQYSNDEIIFSEEPTRNEEVPKIPLPTTSIRPSLLLTDITDEYLSNKGLVPQKNNINTPLPPILSHPVTSSSNQITYNSIPKDVEPTTSTRSGSNEEVTTLHTEILKIPKNKSIGTKENELDSFTQEPEVEIITDNDDSFEKIFHEVVENIPVPNLSTVLPEIKNEIYPSPIPQVPKQQTNVANPKNVKDPTPLSVLAAPNSQVPAIRVSGKSTITKVSAPHISSTATLLSPTNSTEPISASSNKERRVFSNVGDILEEKIPPHDSSMNWYFSNYNKTNLQPYIDPALNFVDNKSGSFKVFSDIRLVALIIVNYFLFI